MRFESRGLVCPVINVPYSLMAVPLQKQLQKAYLAYLQCILIFFQGYGTFFYSDLEYYEGEWYADKRCGWGRMFYEDGSVYEGEWDEDKCNGRGMLRLSME